ncbi:MAG TPA: hypothetical protein DCS07_04535 [Bdellovibrionales bacterium]|nr:hypothetical protein [Bdellovibrionales bacterium]
MSFGAITPTPASRSNSNWLTAVVNASEESILSCSLDAQNLGISSSPVQLSALAEGAHELIVGGVDRAGNHAAPIKHSFTVDLTAPVTTLGSAVGAITHETSNVFVFSASEAATFECNLNGVGFNACTSPIQISGFADGEHYFRVRATDLAGNLGPVVSALWTVDLTAPVVTLTVSRSANASIQFGFSSNEAGSVFTCSLDGAAFTSCSSPLAFSGLAIGNHSFIVRASDPQGNSDPAGVSHAWTVEPLVTTKIISVVPSATFTNQRTANFSFDTNVGVNFICGLDGGALAPCVSPVSYTGMVDGLHNFLVYAIDRWDVQDPVGAQYSWTVDGTVPVVVSITHSYTRSSATINWTTNEPSSAQLNWGVGTDTSRLIPDNGIYSTAHTVTITGLSSNTQYAYIVGGRDQAGNSYQYTKRAFRTNP